jgi:hypothetical protein
MTSRLSLRLIVFVIALGVAIGIALGGYRITRPDGSQFGGGVVQAEPINHKECPPEEQKKYEKNPDRAVERCERATEKCEKQEEKKGKPKKHCQP